MLVAALPAADSGELKAELVSWPGAAKAAWTCTLDDGIRDQYTIAAPLLKKYELPATFFVLAWAPESTEKAEAKKPGSWSGITWEEMKELIADGHEIGNHSWSHQDFRRMPAEKYDKEILAAQERIAERVGVKPTTFCFPFNGMNEASLAVVQESHLAWRTNYRQFGGGAKAAGAARWLDEEESRAGWTVLMVHGLQKGYDAFKDLTQFEAHLQEVAKRRDAGDLWPATFREVSAYKKMRDSAELKTEELGERRMKLWVESPLPEAQQRALTVSLADAPEGLRVISAGNEVPLQVKDGLTIFDLGKQSVELTW